MSIAQKSGALNTRTNDAQSATNAAIADLRYAARVVCSSSWHCLDIERVPSGQLPPLPQVVVQYPVMEQDKKLASHASFVERN